MANENFSLGFTVSEAALWNDLEEGKFGEAGTVFSDVVAENKFGEAGTLFADIVAENKFGEAGTLFADIVSEIKFGEAGTVNTLGLCAINILSLPGQSTLSGGPHSVATCH